MSQPMTDQPAGPGHTVGRIEDAVQQGPDAVGQLFREEIIFRAFENDLVEYYGDNEYYDYPMMAISPAKFEGLNYHLDPLVEGYAVTVTSEYRTQAPLVPAEDDVDEETLGDVEHVDVNVRFRAEASFTSTGRFMDTTVFITEQNPGAGE